jgi:hypothetical protein
MEKEKQKEKEEKYKKVENISFFDKAKDSIV